MSRSIAWGFSPTLLVLVLLMPFLSLGMAVANTIVGSALTKSVYPDEVGGIIGLSTATGSLTRIPAPFVAGLLLGVSGWAPGSLAGVLTLAVVPFAYQRLIRRPDAPLPPRTPPVAAAARRLDPARATCDLRETARARCPGRSQYRCAAGSVAFAVEPHLAGEYLVDQVEVEQHERHADRRDDEHDRQRELRGCRRGDGERRSGTQAGNEVREDRRGPDSHERDRRERDARTTRTGPFRR